MAACGQLGKPEDEAVRSRPPPSAHSVATRQRKVAVPAAIAASANIPTARADSCQPSLSHVGRLAPSAASWQGWRAPPPRMRPPPHLRAEAAAALQAGAA